MLRIFFFAIALAVSTYGDDLPPVPTLNGLIVGGIPCSIKEAPYQVSLILDYFYSAAFYHVCSGTIISRNFVLTAAHCTNGTSALRWQITFGSADIDTGSTYVGVSSILENPDFNSRMDNDIALVKLSSSLLTGPNVQSITLPAQGNSIPYGSTGFVTGWGPKVEGGSIQFYMSKTSAQIITQGLCSNAYSNLNPVTSNMICAIQIGVDGRNACQGDPGSPMIVDKMIVGITSWGYGCAKPEYPVVFTKVANYRNWIHANLVN